MPRRPDDETIPDEVLLWRGILEDWVQPLPNGQTRPRSLAFVEGSETQELSLFIGAETTAAAVMAGRPWVALAQVTAGALRERGYSIARDPEGGDGNPAHVVATPAEGKSHKQVQKDAKRIVERATWVPGFMPGQRPGQHPH
jgi:uncharacterized membrane protein